MDIIKTVKIGSEFESEHRGVYERVCVWREERDGKIMLLYYNLKI